MRSLAMMNLIAMIVLNVNELILIIVKNKSRQKVQSSSRYYQICGPLIHICYLLILLQNFFSIFLCSVHRFGGNLRLEDKKHKYRTFHKKVVGLMLHKPYEPVKKENQPYQPIREGPTAGPITFL